MHLFGTGPSAHPNLQHDKKPAGASITEVQSAPRDALNSSEGLNQFPCTCWEQKLRLQDSDRSISSMRSNRIGQNVQGAYARQPWSAVEMASDASSILALLGVSLPFG